MDDSSYLTVNEASAKNSLQHVKVKSLRRSRSTCERKTISTCAVTDTLVSLATVTAAQPKRNSFTASNMWRKTSTALASLWTPRTSGTSNSNSHVHSSDNNDYDDIATVSDKC
jgi:phage tail sheath gpL-like